MITQDKNADTADTIDERDSDIREEEDIGTSTLDENSSPLQQACPSDVSSDTQSTHDEVEDLD